MRGCRRLSGGSLGFGQEGPGSVEHCQDVVAIASGWYLDADPGPAWKFFGWLPAFRRQRGRCWMWAAGTASSPLAGRVPLTSGPGSRTTVSWCHCDVLTHPLEAGPFDAVVSNAALHHLGDTRAALLRLGQLVRPGGVLAVVGFARTQWRDWPWAAVAFVARGIPIRVRGVWEHTAPTVWPPTDTGSSARSPRRCCQDPASAACSWVATC